jgi:hypothetical protein
MPCMLEISRYFGGKLIAKIGPFHHEVAARQAILDHAGLIDFPQVVYGANYYAPCLAGIVEGWILDNGNEYVIKNI